MEIILMLLSAIVAMFLISRVCIFFANKNVNPYPDTSEYTTEEARALEEQRQRLSIQGTYQMNECMKGKIRM